MVGAGTEFARAACRSCPRQAAKEFVRLRSDKLLDGDDAIFAGALRLAEVLVDARERFLEPAAVKRAGQMIFAHFFADS